MAYEIQIDGERQLAFVRLNGSPGLVELIEAVKAIFAHPRYRNDMNVICDFRGADLGRWTVFMLISLGKLLNSFPTRHGAKIGLVADRDFEFGVLRLWPANADDEYPLDRMVFKKMDDAIKWIGG